MARQQIRRSGLANRAEEHRAQGRYLEHAYAAACEGHLHGDQVLKLVADELVRRADEALYRAKRAGRNRVRSGRGFPRSRRPRAPEGERVRSTPC